MFHDKIESYYNFRISIFTITFAQELSKALFTFIAKYL